MDRSRKGNPSSNVLAFRIPERTEAPKLPPANVGAVVKFRRKAAARPICFPEDEGKTAYQLFGEALELRRAARAGRV